MAESSGSTAVGGAVGLVIAGATGVMLGIRRHADFPQILLDGAIAVGALLAGVLVLALFVAPCLLVRIEIRERRDRATRAQWGAELAEWLGLEGPEQVTDADCTVWRQTAKIVSAAEAARWSAHGLPFTMIPHATKMGLTLYQVVDIVDTLTTAGFQCRARRELDEVLFGGDDLDGWCYQHWNLFPKADVIQAVRSELDSAGDSGRGVWRLNGAYHQLAHNRFGESWHRKLNRARPSLG